MKFLNFPDSSSFLLSVVRELGYPSISEITSYQFINSSKYKSSLTYNTVNHHIKKAVSEQIIQKYKPEPEGFRWRFGYSSEVTFLPKKLFPLTKIDKCSFCGSYIIENKIDRHDKKHLNLRGKKCELIEGDSESIFFIRISFDKIAVVHSFCNILGVVVDLNNPRIIFPHRSKKTFSQKSFTDHYLITSEIHKLGFRDVCIPSIVGLEN